MSSSQGQESFLDKVKHTIQDTGKAIKDIITNTFSSEEVPNDENVDPNLIKEKPSSYGIKESIHESGEKEKRFPEKIGDVGLKYKENLKQNDEEKLDPSNYKAINVQDTSKENINQSVSVLPEKTSDLKESTKDKFESSKQNTSNIIDSMKENVQETVGSISNVAEKSWDKTKEKAGEIKKSLEGSWETNKQKASEMEQDASEKVQSAKETVIQAKQKVKDSMENSGDKGSSIYESNKDNIKDNLDLTSQQVGGKVHDKNESADDKLEQSKDYLKGGLLGLTEYGKDKSDEFKDFSYEDFIFAGEKVASLKEPIEKKIENISDKSHQIKETLEKVMEKQSLDPNVPETVNYSFDDQTGTLKENIDESMLRKVQISKP